MSNDSTHLTHSTSGGKRSWEAASQWCGDNGNSSTQAYSTPPKRNCVSWPAGLQESVIAEKTNFEDAVVLPSFHLPRNDDVSLMGSTISSSWEPSNAYLPPLMDSVGFNTMYDMQSLTNQFLPSQDYNSGQQWTQSGNDICHLTPANSSSSIWPAPNLPALQAPARYDEYMPWRISEYGQQGYVVNPCETTTSTSSILDRSFISHTFAGSSNIDDSLDDGQIQLEDSSQGIASPTTSSPTSQDSTSSDLAASGTTPNETSYDSCFGMVVLDNFQLQRDFFTGKRCKAVTLEVNGTMVTIQDTDSKKYGGLLGVEAARVIISLVETHAVELSASIISPDQIEVLIYGRREEADSIGDMLLERDCFLQPPNSYDVSRPYHNPQCLADPDHEAETFWVPDGSSSTQATVLDENKKSKVAELLDSAIGPATFRVVHVSDILITKLKKHQLEALSMMMEKESGSICDANFPTVWVEYSNGESSHLKFYNTVTQRPIARTPRLCLGGLLADDMGLGKTLTTLALIATSLDKTKYFRSTPVTLIVCPLTTVTGWQDQIERHFKKGSLTYRIYHGSARDNDMAVLKSNDIVLTTYETLRSELPIDGVAKRVKRKHPRGGLLHSIDWHRVVLDEAHIVRNRSSKTFQAVDTLRAGHRWCLTGTPIQNRLEDLGTLVEFLRVDPFDNPGAFKSTFVTPIDNGQQFGWNQLRLLIQSIALRRTKDALDADLHLPPRQEVIQRVDLSDEEKTLYNLVKRRFALAIDSGGSVMNTFQLILRLRQICNHGLDLLPQNLRAWLGDISVFDNGVVPQFQRCEVCDTAIDGEDAASYYVFSCFHQVCRICLRDKDAHGGTDSVCPACDVDTLERAEAIVDKAADSRGFRSTPYRPSSKVKALLKNLKENQHAKSVIFSAWTGMLDHIGQALSMNGFAYQRLDGSRSLTQRRHALQEFRANPSCMILLASLGSAAVGVDLTMANHVHLMEPGWNPSLEQQALDRVHRLGQEKEVVATRYVVSGPDSIEEYVRRRQEWKMNLIASSFDDSKAHRNKAEAILKVS
ncbi:SNF2 family N-terminal domain-containing protein [Hypoxylon sp. NC1633]|nr:SNF2 family N-terminal domain-containing protein [Hypoxylon sp. NC1633]